MYVWIINTAEKWLFWIS